MGKIQRLQVGEAFKVVCLQGMKEAGAEVERIDSSELGKVGDLVVLREAPSQCVEDSVGYLLCPAM